MKKNKNLLYVIICLIAYMGFGIRVASMYATLFVGTNAIRNSIELYKDQEKRSAIFSFCIGIVLCGFVVIETIEIIVNGL